MNAKCPVFCRNSQQLQICTWWSVQHFTPIMFPLNRNQKNIRRCDMTTTLVHANKLYIIHADNARKTVTQIIYPSHYYHRTHFSLLFSCSCHKKVWHLLSDPGYHEVHVHFHWRHPLSGVQAGLSSHVAVSLKCLQKACNYISLSTNKLSPVLNSCFLFSKFGPHKAPLVCHLPRYFNCPLRYTSFPILNNTTAHRTLQVKT